MPDNNDAKVVLVTGASSGFGRQIALLLHSKGYKVFGTSRKSLKPYEGFRMLRLDVNSDKSVKECVSYLLSEHGRIDVLINNAGYVLGGALEEASIKEAKLQFETNLFGAVRMANAVLPSMRKRRSGQIINISSLAATFPVAYEGYYAVSKAALVAYSDVLRQEVKGFNVKVSVVEPGFFNTNLSATIKVPKKSISDYKDDKEKVLGRFKNSVVMGQDPKVVANAVLKIIESGSPRLRYPVGKEKHYLFIKKVLPEPAFESIMRKYLGLD